VSDQRASVSFPKMSTRMGAFAFSYHLRTEEELASEMICFSFTVQQKGVSDLLTLSSKTYKIDHSLFDF
jgi:hypothetical protein